MTPVDPTSSLGSSAPLNPPAGIKLDTPEQQQMYKVSLEFERFFVQQLLKPMQDSGSALPGAEEDGGTSSMGGYKDMAQDQLTQSVLDGGGLGLAATLYGQMAEAAGILTTPATKTDGAATTPATTKPAAATTGAEAVA